MRNKIYLIIFFLLLNFKQTIAQQNIKSTYNFSADKINYSQDSNIIEASGKVVAKNQDGNEISADKIIYNKNDGILKAIGKTKFVDNKGDIIYSDILDYDLGNNKITAQSKVTLIDKYKNIFYFSKIVADDQFSEITGFDMDSDLAKDKFNQDNQNKNHKFIEPRLSGKEAKISDDIVYIKDGNFTTCHRSDKNEPCATYNVKANQIIWDKPNKEIVYLDSSLNLQNIPVLYSPYFSFPDPTVQRRSGFLSPTAQSLGTNIGYTVAEPYFWNISNSADLTLTPVLYFTQNPLIKTQYRQALKDGGSLSIEGGFTKGYSTNKPDQGITPGSKDYLYANLRENYKDLILDKSVLNAKIQRVNNPTFLQSNQIASNPMDKFLLNPIKSTDTQLINEFDLNSFGKNQNLDIKANVLENNSVGATNRYQYTLPQITYSKSDVLPDKLKGLNFNTNFRDINQSNQTQTKNINDLSYNTPISYDKSTGVQYNFLTQVKNINYNNYSTSNISSVYANAPKQNFNSEIDPILGFDMSLPMGKISQNSEQYLTPRLLTRYSPGSMANSSNTDLHLNYDNLFALNRMNNQELVEKDLSFNLGANWTWEETNKFTALEDNTNNKSEFSIGQVYKPNTNKYMPNDSSLQKNLSNIVTSYTYTYPKNFQIKLDNSFHSNPTNGLTYYDYEFKKYFNNGDSQVKVNYYEKDYDITPTRYAGISYIQNFTDNTKLTLKGDRNLITDRPNSYSTTLSYENECIRYGVWFEKDYSTNVDTQPRLMLMFGVTILPFGDAYQSPNLAPAKLF